MTRARFLLLCSAVIFAAFFASLALTQPTQQITIVGVQTAGDCVAFNSPNVLKDNGGTCAAASPVQSVFGRTGTVVAATNDYTFAQIGSTPTTLAGYGITSPASLAVFNATTGFQVNGAATTGNVLRGNGTNFVNATLAAADLSNSVTGTGAVVLAASPALTGNPGIGAPASTPVNDQAGALRPLIVEGSDTSTTIAGSLADLVISNSNTTTSNTAQLGFAAVTGASATRFTSGAINVIFGARTNNQYPTGAMTFSVSQSVNTAPAESMRISTSGGLSIGTTTDPGSGAILANTSIKATTTLTVAGMANVATTSAVCYNTGTGLFTYDGSIGTCTVSDERLKNIGERIPDALDRLLKIDGFYYTWKDPVMGIGQQIGVGAQTVERVFPELVTTDSEGTKSVDYQRLTAPIIEAIRELKADNDSLRARLDAK